MGPDAVPSNADHRSDASRPLRRDAEQNRQRIVAAAREVFATQGLSAGLNEVARHAGVGVGTTYRRFPDKDALVEAVMRDQIAALQRVARTALEFDSAWDGLVYLLETVAEMQAADRGFRDLMLLPESTESSTQHVREHLAPLLDQLTARAHQEGTLRRDVGTTDLALSQVIISEFAHHSAGTRATAYRRFLWLVLDGMRARPGQEDLPESAITPDETDSIIESWGGPALG